MIIDSGHRNWFLGTALASAVTLGIYIWCDRRIVGGVTGGTTIGLWFGVLGTLLMIFVGLQAALRKVPSWWWIGSRKAWLKAHIWLGLLSVVIILAHSGFRIGGVLGLSLWIVLAAIILSGVIGLILQQVLPSVLARRVPDEVSFEQLPHYCSVLKRRADGLADAIAVFLPAGDPDTTFPDFSTAYDEQLRPQLTTEAGSTSLNNEENLADWFGRMRELLQLPILHHGAAEIERVLNDLRERAPADKKKEVEAVQSQFVKLMSAEEPQQLATLAKSAGNSLRTVTATLGATDRAAGIERLCAAAWFDQLEGVCQERNRLRFQERLHGWLHGWLLIHTPLSAALLVLIIAHVIMSLYY